MAKLDILIEDSYWLGRKGRIQPKMINIYVDDEQVGALMKGQRLSLEIAPGQHTTKVHSDRWFEGSKLTTFTIDSEKQDTQLYIKPNIPVYLFELSPILFAVLAWTMAGKIASRSDMVTTVIGLAICFGLLGLLTQALLADRYMVISEGE